MPHIVKWSSSHKLVVILGALLIIFFISTVVLAVKLQDKQQHWRQKFSELSRTLSVHKVPIKRTIVRLPRNVLPNNYNITLSPQLSTKTFDGFVTIFVKVVKPTNTIVFHASRSLNISSVTVKHEDTEIARFEDVTPDDDEIIHLHLPKVISADDYEISATYSGSLDKKIVGLYSSTLRNGSLEHIQFQNKTKKHFIEEYRSSWIKK